MLNNFPSATTALPKIILSEDNLDRLAVITASIGRIDWSEPNLSNSVRHDLVQASNKVKESPSLSEVLSYARNDYLQEGYCVLGLPFGRPQDENLLRKELVFLLSNFGLPFGAFQKRGFWQSLGVNHEAKELRAESPGYIPLHIDFNQAKNPPDGVALFCARPDPRGGGENTIFNYAEYLSELSPEELSQLSKIEYSYSVLYEQNGIGPVYNPHPLLELTGNKPGLFRYNGKAIKDIDKELTPVFEKLENIFKASASVIGLAANDLLVMDQKKVLHGRLPLKSAESNEAIPAGQDRFLWQTYLRHIPG